MDRKLVVVHVVQQLDCGGAEKIVGLLGSLADRRRFDLRFICLGGRGEISTALESLGYQVTHLNCANGFKPRLWWQLYCLFRAWKADVVHSHNRRALVFASPAAKLAGVRAILNTQHGAEDYNTTWKLKVFLSLVSPSLGRQVHVANALRLRAVSAGYSEKRMLTIWNGIDLSAFEFSGPRYGGPVTFVGRLSPEKDVASLITAASLVVKTHPHFRLSIAGDGACRADLERQVRALSIEHVVTFHGEIADVSQVLKPASLFVLPSLTEGISLAIIEAMASGLAVVATSVGGTPEIVDDGKTGLLVPSRDPQKLAEALVRLLENESLARELGAAGRRRAELHFSAAHMVGRYEALYTELLATEGSNPVSSIAAPRRAGGKEK